jgi:hypothetical protein
VSRAVSRAALAHRTGSSQNASALSLTNHGVP